MAQPMVSHAKGDLQCGALLFLGSLQDQHLRVQYRALGGLADHRIWLILHNRFVVERGRGIFAKTASFDHIIRGNVVAIQDKRSHGLFLATPDCIGVELIDNTFYGAAGVYAGTAELAVERGNRLLRLEETTPPRPVPDVPSICEWQKDNIPVVHELPIR
jgi:hypothetical protein